jgi:large conductance mechanosensitive channel
MNIGTFIQNVVDFLIIALLVFLMIKTINRLKEQIAKKIGKEEADKNLTEPKDIQLLSEIRDLLKENLSAK